MANCFADRLLATIDERGSPSVVALDPVWESLPAPLTGGVPDDDVGAILAVMGEFSRRVIDTIAPIVPAVKINSAYFERYHAGGVALYDDLIAYAASRGMVTIGDCKRGDVGHTAEMYARACLGGEVESATFGPGPDAVTINGYFGIDGAKPFIDVARLAGKGLFVLVRTSNPSAASIQDVALADGRKVHEVVAAQVAAWSADSKTFGAGGYSAVGAVVATRHSDDAAKLRAAMPHSMFLVPGYGAQGGRAEDFAPYFDRSGRGAVIAAGRSVIFAYRDGPFKTANPLNWQTAIESACREFARDVAPLMQR